MPFIFHCLYICDKKTELPVYLKRVTITFTPFKRYIARVRINMKAVILVGGEGTRLRPLTNNTVKAMVPVLNKPFIWYVIEHLKEHYVDTIILAMGYKPDSIRNYFDINSIPGITLVYSEEPEPLGTAGAVKYAEQYIDSNEPFFVLNGDIFTDMNLTEMLQVHRKRNAIITISLTPVEDPTRFGIVETDSQQRVERFVEKPSRDQITTNLINAGVYILEPDVLERIPHGKWSMFERETFPQLIEEGKPVYGYPTHTYWMDMGTADKYIQLNFDLLNRESPVTRLHQSTIPPDPKLKGPVSIDSGCKIGKNIILNGPLVIGPNCTIGDSAAVEKSIIWHNVKVGHHTVIKNSIVLNDTIIADNANVDNTIVAGTMA
jgi:mannose-1-phosphate guanylyltransferase